MNPGWCKKCGAAIYWVPRHDGGWHRPMERLKTLLPQETQDLIDGRQAYQVEDGSFEPFRFSTVLVWHECGAKPEAVQESIQAYVQSPTKLSKKARKRAKRELRDARIRQEAERIEAERLVAERRAAQQAQAEKDAERRRVMLAERHGEFLRVECPFCGAASGEGCHSMATGMGPDRSNYYNAKPHQQRVDWGYGSGQIEETLEQRHSQWWPELVKDASVIRQRQLLAWLDGSQDLWSEDWPTTSVTD